MEGFRQDAVFHADGTLAEGPIALAEVQGYTYAAKRGAAETAALLWRFAPAQDLLRQAQALQERFAQVFWCADLRTYSLPWMARNAVPGAYLQCGPLSFFGNCQGRACRTHGPTLMGDEIFSGWGIRTLAASEVRYNPMSYHNGSIWPHDNALTAYGLSRYGLRDSRLRF